MTNDARDRILQMVASGQVTAQEAAQLLDALTEEQNRTRNRMVRVRVTDLATSRIKINVTIPVGLIQVGMRLGLRLAPQLSAAALDELLRAIAGGSVGRLLDLHDMEEGERLEIFVE
ncbi:MAG: SHOCT-like domain-containing protein [Chloroflexaceae bacterium]